MAFTSPKMSLRVWNQLEDAYDHNQLADNWMRVDQHDHTPGRGVQIPTEGIADGAVTNEKLAASSITATPTDASVSLTKLASDTNAFIENAYSGYWRDATRTAGLDISSNGTSTTYTLSSPSLSLGTGVNTWNTDGMFWLNPADYTVPNHNTVFRISATIQTGSVALANPATFQLQTVKTQTPGGAGGHNVLSSNTVVSGSSAVISSIGTSATGHADSSAFAITSGGLYVITLNLTINGPVNVFAKVQQQQVPS